MRRRKRHPVLLRVLLFLVLCCMPVLVQAEVDWNILSTLNLDKSPIDVATTADGKWAYILTPGEVLVYSLTSKVVSGRIPVDKSISRISATSRGDQIFVVNEKTKTLSIINVAIVQKFNVADSPFKGPVDAPVVIAVFSDYQSPFCAQINALLQQVLDQYPKEVKLVLKDYPMPSQKFSRQASVAALAAGEQNKYWEYHDKIYQNYTALSPEKFLDFARELGLDMDAFQKSLVDPKHENHIQKDTQDAVTAGVTGTPTIFVNGRFLMIRNIEGFKVMINEELQKKK